MSILTAIRAARETLERDAAPITLRDAGLSLEDPKVSLSSPGAYQLLSGTYPTASGEAINEQTALRISTVFACIRVISNGVASMPVRIFSLDGATRTEAVDHSLHYLLTREPNPEMTAYTWLAAMAGSMAASGNGYSIIERNKSGQPVGLWPVPSRLIEPKRDKQTRNIVYVYTDPDTRQTRTFAAADVIHCLAWCQDGLKGYSPIEQARQSLGLAAAAEKYAAQFFGTGGMPNGIMQTSDDLDQAELSTAKDGWDKQRAGSGSAGKTVFVAGNWTYKDIAGVSMKDAQFVESRRLSIETICGLFGVPAHLIGSGDKLSNSNWENQSLSLVIDTLSPYAERIAQELHRKLLGTDTHYTISFDPTGRLKADVKTTMEAVALGRQWAVLDTDEARQQLGFNPIGGDAGKMVLAPVNMMPVDRMLTAPQPTAPTKVDDSASRSLLVDCVGRFNARAIRDADAMRQVFGPAIRSIVATVALYAARDMRLAAPPAVEPIAEDIIRQIAKRDTLDADKILRSITLHVYREAGVALAEGR